MPNHYDPCHLRSEHVTYLLDNQYVAYQADGASVSWFGVVATLNASQGPCFRVLWENFLRGNLPLPAQRILGASSGQATNLGDIFKRTDLKRKQIIVGDRRGNFWLNVPSAVMLHLNTVFQPPICSHALSSDRDRSGQLAQG